METWFGAQYYLYMWIPGTALGCVAGIAGTLAGIFAPRGRWRGLVQGLFLVTIIASAAMLAAGIIAKLSGQPYGVWYGLGLPGAIGLVVMGLNYPVIRKVYAKTAAREPGDQDP